MEMGYVHVFFFKQKLTPMLRMLLPLLILGAFVCCVEMGVELSVNGYLEFFLYGILFVVINGVTAVLISLFFSRNEFVMLVKRCLSLLKRI